PVGGGSDRVSSRQNGGLERPPLRNLAARAGIDILAAVATLIDAPVVAALDATQDVASGCTNDGADTGAYNRSQKAAAGSTGANNSAAESANSRPLLSGRAGSQ